MQLPTVIRIGFSYSFVLMICFFAIIIYDGFVSDKKVDYDSAIVLQSDNTVVIGDLEWYTICDDMIKIKMNGKTYLVPHTNITLIADEGN